MDVGQAGSEETEDGVNHAALCTKQVKPQGNGRDTLALPTLAT